MWALIALVLGPPEGAGNAVAAPVVVPAPRPETGQDAPPPPPAAPAAAAEPVQVPVAVGAYAPVSLRAAELGPVFRAAVAHLTPTRHARARLISAERQVVAGMNYRVLLKLRDGSRWRVTVWQRLDRSLKVTEALRAEP